jgi:hypothetical protein
MDWLLRFWLGMTCRQEDFAHVSERFPELLDHDSPLEPRLTWPFWWFEGDPRDLIARLRVWLQAGAEVTDTGTQVGNG